MLSTCRFGSDPAVQVMVYHAALAAQRALALADGEPCILAGDFNFAPDSAPYAVLTRGSLDAAHPHQPPVRAHDPWRPSLPRALRSAYVAATGEEPDFTNLAVTRFQPDTPFCGTLDYIFLGDGAAARWKVRRVRELPHRERILAETKSYPTAAEPSDHVAIWCDLDLVEEGESP
jgi:endonuclease/exonuclease/phosphatase family metal-dependent hydrolase